VIRHIVLWRLKSECKQAGRIPNIDRIRHNVAAMRAAVPGLLHLDVALNQVPMPDAADLILYSEFESWQALRGYEDHPLHVELRSLISPLRLERRVVDYEAVDEP
jgi:hypothetical protein